MIKTNLSKPRFILLLSVIILLLIILFVQFITLGVLRNKQQNLSQTLSDLTEQAENILDDVSEEDKLDYNRWNGDKEYIYNDEELLIEQ